MQADRSVEKRMAELAGRAERTGIGQIAWFLSPAELTQADICARQAGVTLHTCGGTPDAERRVAAFGDEDWAPDWPVDCLQLGWHARYGAPGHRDILGSLMGLGIGREKVGDIFVQEGVAYVFILREMGTYVAANLERAGSTPVRISVMADWPELAAAEGVALRDTVASLRLDAIIGAAWNLSRGKASALVASGRVQVDHREELRGDRQITEGAVISVRGLGRAKLEAIGGKTKKGRYSIEMIRY